MCPSCVDETLNRFTEDEVFRIVDSCFHAFASSYRSEAKDYVKGIMMKWLIEGSE